MNAKPWFNHKRYGAGFSAGSWQGWVVTIAYGVTVVLGSRAILVWGDDSWSSLVIALAFIAAMTFVYAGIVWRTRDRSRRVKWRWGRSE